MIIEANDSSKQESLIFINHYSKLFFQCDMQPFSNNKRISNNSIFKPITFV